MGTINTKGLKIACGCNFISDMKMRECGKEGDYCWRCEEHNNKVDVSKSGGTN